MRIATTNLTARQFDHKLAELQNFGKDFKLISSSSENLLEVYEFGQVKEKYKTSLVADFTHPSVLQTVKKAQARIIQHVEASPALLEKLGEPLEPINYVGCQHFTVNKAFSLHQIDIKSAYFTAACKLGFIPNDLKKEIEELEETFLKAGQNPKDAKANAKQARLILLGSLAKKRTETVYKCVGIEEVGADFNEHIDTETGEVHGCIYHYETVTTESRVKGLQIANVFFCSAQYVTELLNNIFIKKGRTTSDILFFWVDAIFCKAAAVQEVRTELTKVGFEFKEYPPVLAYYSNFDYYLQSSPTVSIDPENSTTFKKYSFKRSQASAFTQNVLKAIKDRADQVHATKEVADLFAGVGVYNSYRERFFWDSAEGFNGQEIFSAENWQKLKTRLYCYGIDANGLKIKIEYFELLGEREYYSLVLQEAEKFAATLQSMSTKDIFITGKFAVEI